MEELIFKALFFFWLLLCREPLLFSIISLFCKNPFSYRLLFCLHGQLWIKLSPFTGIQGHWIAPGTCLSYFLAY